MHGLLRKQTQLSRAGELGIRNELYEEMDDTGAFIKDRSTNRGGTKSAQSPKLAGGSKKNHYAYLIPIAKILTHPTASSSIFVCPWSRRTTSVTTPHSYTCLSRL